MKIRRSIIYWRQEGGGGGGTGGTGGTGSGGGGTGGGSGTIIPLDQQNETARIKRIEQENEELKKRNQLLDDQYKQGSKKLEELHATIVSPEYLQYIAARKKGKGGGGGEGGEGGERGPTAEEINEMDNAELVGFISKSVQKAITSAMGPVREVTDNLSAADQVRTAAGRFKDFWDYQEAMVQISERNPALDPSAIYLMVKGLEASTGKSYKGSGKKGSGEGEEEGERGTAEVLRGGGEEGVTRRFNRPASSETVPGPDGALGTAREKEPKTYGEAAGLAFDRIFGRS